jgi:hypothetical protein
MLNANIPSFKALVRKSYFTKNIEDSDEFYNVYVLVFNRVLELY